MPEFKVGDLVRMKASCMDYWTAGCIGRLVKPSMWNDGSWNISFGNCGNLPGSFETNRAGWCGSTVTAESNFIMHARYGSVENPKPEPVKVTISDQRYSRYTYQPYPPTNTF